jgi:hypothetical protein
MAALADGSGAVFAPVLPVELPAGRSGLMVRAAGPVAGRESLTVLEQESGVVVGDAPDLQFVPALRATLAQVAFGLVASPRVAVVVVVVVVCPVGVSSEGTALALAVGDLLWARGGRPVVMCDVGAAKRSATEHPVLVRDPAGVVTVRRVWQLVTWTAARGWLRALSAHT